MGESYFRDTLLKTHTKDKQTTVCQISTEINTQKSQDYTKMKIK